MSSNQVKVSLGVMPEQKEDYSQYEESELRWDRIIPSGIIILLVLILGIYWLFSDNDVTTYTAKLPVFEKQESTPAATIEVKETKAIDRKKAVVIVQEEVMSPIKQVEQVEQVEQVQAKPKTPVKQAPTKTLSPVKILDTHIKRAQLSSNLEKGMPVDTLSAQVIMSEAGIIKVHLYTEMSDLSGHYLFHEWYLNGKKQARVKIPVNHKHQRSSSSKFINQQMLGAWHVKVIDEQGKLYIQADFKVSSP